jgi:hypothetical protein
LRLLQATILSIIIRLSNVGNTFASISSVQCVVFVGRRKRVPSCVSQYFRNPLDQKANKIMKAFYVLVVVILAFTSTGTHAFVPNTGSSSNGNTAAQKRTNERRPAFSAAPLVEKEEIATTNNSPAVVPGPSPSAIFALPPTAVSAALAAAYEEEETMDVSYGVAMVSCFLSLALGFGIGYGV